MSSMCSMSLATICSRILRQRADCSWRLRQAPRRRSSAASATAVTLTERSDAVKGGGTSYTLTMNSPPANTFTSAFLLQFIDAMYRLSEQLSVRSLVIKSALPTIFSSGFDLDELSNPASRQQLTEFLKLFRQAFHCLYTAPFYTVAQISGHAPAGGCALALACDYRIALDSDRIKIGLTPTKVGITPPAWLIRLAESRFASSHACERAVLPAQLYTPRQALSLGLADQVAASDDQLDQLVAAHLGQVHSADRVALGHVRSVFTRRVLDLMSDEADLGHFVDSVLGPECQALLAKARGGGRKAA